MITILNNIIDSVWLAAVLLLVSLILATTLPQASALWWLLALVAGGVTYAGNSLGETELLLTPRDLLSLAVFSIGLGMGLVAISSGPLGGIQFVTFIAGVLAVRLARYKGLLPWIQ
ncbi:hypothetical protein [Serratia ficaria]|uniref:hypothetical protein n=1 Tax=Serratia ficaria TaxID=61651 RepID=UPI00217C7FDA|nr:hypothetical protein [Serratia ficaria]CAI0791173.1 Uncharacterised protein [Serratia ficaria]CAI1237046.1 Uncharacterised protein [Serratia ficaria]CAI2024105.1 Uncharacterised protein [Serratia ficaria]CAI2407887.1 Uncharacterised protein [Serratia ficaria]CAI2438924.1 Uncharacterised protein [Serratia ficaria]